MAEEEGSGQGSASTVVANELIEFEVPVTHSTVSDHEKVAYPDNR